MGFMTAFVLLHGAWHGAWIWKNVEQGLQVLGHTVYALNLPGHAENNSDLSLIHLSTYVEYVKDYVCGLDVEHVVLIGHSMSGVVISQVAEEIPRKISKIIYLTAFVPDLNGSLFEEEGISYDRNVAPEIIVDNNKGRIIITHSQRLKFLFYDMCTEEESLYAITRLQDQPLSPFVDKVSLTKESFGSVDKLYIECAHDNAISIRDQRRMHSKLRCPLVTLNSDHSPFFSCPEQLIQALLK